MKSTIWKCHNGQTDNLLNKTKKDTHPHNNYSQHVKNITFLQKKNADLDWMSWSNMNVPQNFYFFRFLGGWGIMKGQRAKNTCWKSWGHILMLNWADINNEALHYWEGQWHLLLWPHGTLKLRKKDTITRAALDHLTQDSIVALQFQHYDICGAVLTINLIVLNESWHVFRMEKLVFDPQ